MRRFHIYLIGIVVTFALTSCGGESKSTDSPISTSMTEVTEAPTELQKTAAETTVPTEPVTVAEEATSAGVINSNGESVDVKAVNDYYNSLLDSSNNPAKAEKIGNEDMEVLSEEWSKVQGEWNQRCEDYDVNSKKDTATKFGITPEEVETIFLNEYVNNMSEKPNVKILHGELLDVVKAESNGIVIKAKISPSFSNKATIDQNYFNIEDFIKNQNGSQYDNVEYWAVADMASGDESKVISFSVDKDLIEAIADEDIAAIQLGDYVDDLYILPSLLQ